MSPDLEMVAIAGYLFLLLVTVIMMIPFLERLEKMIFSWLEKKIRRDLLDWKNR